MGCRERPLLVRSLPLPLPSRLSSPLALLPLAHSTGRAYSATAGLYCSHAFNRELPLPFACTPPLILSSQTHFPVKRSRWTRTTLVCTRGATRPAAGINSLRPLTPLYSATTNPTLSSPLALTTAPAPLPLHAQLGLPPPALSTDQPLPRRPQDCSTTLSSLPKRNATRARRSFSSASLLSSS